MKWFLFVKVSFKNCHCIIKPRKSNFKHKELPIYFKFYYIIYCSCSDWVFSNLESDHMHFLHTTILKFQLTKHIRVVSATGPYLVYRNIEQLAPNHLRKNRYFYLTSRLRRVQRTSCEYLAFFCLSYISYKMLRRSLVRNVSQTSKYSNL